MDQESQSEASKEVIAVEVRKDNESDTEDDNVVYEVDSDGEIVWKDD